LNSLRGVLGYAIYSIAETISAQTRKHHAVLKVSIKYYSIMVNYFRIPILYIEKDEYIIL